MHSATLHFPDCQPGARNKYLHQIIMQVQAEEVKKKKNPNQTNPTNFSSSLRLILVFSTGILRRNSGQSFWLFTQGAAQGRGGSCSLHQLLAIKQTEQKEFDSKWEAGMWHQGARFMVGFLSILKYTVKLICHQDESLCLSGLSVSVFS